MNNKSYAHVLELVRTRPWAIEPSVYATIRELVARHVSGELLSEAQIAENIAAAQAQYGDRQGAQQDAGVAVIPLYGPIMPKAGLMSDLSGATSVQGFMRNFRQALGDQSVTAIVFDVDSPGGLTDLIPEAAAEIRGSRGQKPIVAVANTLMASAAYWLASQADEVVASPSSLVGSIGVYAEHTDLSGAYELVGVKKTLISAGRYKTEGNDLAPLDETAAAHIQELVDDAYGMFVGDVAKGRGAKASEVKAGFGEGRVLPSSMAVAARLVDRVDTLEGTIKKLLGPQRGRGSAKAEGMAVIEAWGEHVGEAWSSAREAEEFVEQMNALAGEAEDPDSRERFEFERELLERRQ